MAQEADGVRFEQRGVLGLITLDRPRALNALSHAMALAMEAQLDRWAADDSVAAVAIVGAGDKAFCAGGDIRALWEAGRPGGARGRANWPFYADEYRLNAKIKRYPKPYVAVMDGIVMGGGVGVSVHGSLRIATERTLFAMPETGIGLFPDVGATYFLPRLPGQTGIWLGLTGARLRGDDVVRAGLCDGLVPSGDVGRLLDRLAEGSLPEPTRPSTDALGHREEIDRHFAQASVAEIVDSLAAADTEWARETRATILAKSPICTRIAFRQIRQGAGLGFEDCMRLEYRLARFCMTRPDFYEGVRATIIEKDGAPRWHPPSLADIDEALVASAFDPLGAEELTL